MFVNDAARKLIKEFEGLRLKAYRCSAGVLTIGYGHTTNAGAPEVKPGMAISRDEAERIFNRDIERFAARVEALIKVDVTENMFGACVSLAFNIGIGGFSKSSVLRFINRRRFDEAADAFMLWNRVTKNGVRVVERGLTRRRAAEAALFKTEDFDRAIEEPTDRFPDAPKGKSFFASTTNLATGVTAAAGMSAAAREIADNTQSVFSNSNLIMVGLIVVIALGAAYIMRERMKKAEDWAV